jgi:Methyltransferase domain
LEARNTSTQVVDTNPEYFEGTISSFEMQCDLARHITPKRLSAYQQILGRPIRKLLEIGPGSGAYARAYDEAGVAYTAVEIEPSVGEMTRQRTGLDIRVGDFLSLDVGQGYDVVFASQVFEHILNPAKFLARARDVAAGGLLHIDVPNHDSLVSHVRKLASANEYGFIQPPYHMLAYTKRSLTTVLEQSGLTGIDVRAFANDDPVWGQLVTHPSTTVRMVFLAGKLTGMGSLLTATAKL